MTKRIVLILGSAPIAVEAAEWPRAPFTDVVAVNNAWRIRDDYDYFIHADDFVEARRPDNPTGQVITSAEFVPAQNDYGGFVYAGGTMAFTAGYWALHALKPDVMAYFGCDMVYATSGNTHFYGEGPKDPLREDITLRSLEAKCTRLMLHAARQGCACVNLSTQDSRLVFPRAARDDLADLPKPVANLDAMNNPEARERALAYAAPTGKYWEIADQFDTAEIDNLDQLWLDALAAQ